MPEGTTGEFRPLYPAYIPEGYVPAIEDRDENSLVLSYEKEDENGLQGMRSQMACWYQTIHSKGL